jgi:hypothetical protein
MIEGKAKEKYPVSQVGFDIFEMDDGNGQIVWPVLSKGE